MPKFLTDKEFDRLTNRSTMLTGIVAAVLATNSELKEDDVTADFIINAITSNNETDPDLQAKFDALQEEFETVSSERDGLQDQVNNLLNSAAEDSAVISSGSEVTAKPATLLDFANKNAGDTAAIINAAMEDGFLPKQK